MYLLKYSIKQFLELLKYSIKHNLTGKMFTREELEYIGSVCKKHNVIILSDEVYERVVFDENEHVRIGGLPGI